MQENVTAKDQMAKLDVQHHGVQNHNKGKIHVVLNCSSQ